MTPVIETIFILFYESYKSKNSPTTALTLNQNFLQKRATPTNLLMPATYSCYLPVC